jgi:hypothetical protein
MSAAIKSPFFANLKKIRLNAIGKFFIRGKVHYAGGAAKGLKKARGRRADG